MRETQTARVQLAPKIRRVRSGTSPGRLRIPPASLTNQKYSMPSVAFHEPTFLIDVGRPVLCSSGVVNR